MSAAEVIIEFAGEPVAKGRPRLGRGGHVYTPSATVAFERALAWLGKIAMHGRPMLEGPLRVDVLATVAHAAVSRPDADNILKACMDALDGVVFANDAAVVDARIVKMQGLKPSVRIEVAKQGP